MDKSGDLVKSPSPSEFSDNHAPRYASAVFNKNCYMDNIVAFIDGLVIVLALLGGPYFMRVVLYNGHKRKHATKSQAVSTPDELCIHLIGLKLSRM